MGRTQLTKKLWGILFTRCFSIWPVTSKAKEGKWNASILWPAFIGEQERREENGALHRESARTGLRKSSHLNPVSFVIYWSSNVRVRYASRQSQMDLRLLMPRIIETIRFPPRLSLFLSISRVDTIHVMTVTRRPYNALLLHLSNLSPIASNRSSFSPVKPLWLGRLIRHLHMCVCVCLSRNIAKPIISAAMQRRRLGGNVNFYFYLFFFSFLLQSCIYRRRYRSFCFVFIEIFGNWSIYGINIFFFFLFGNIYLINEEYCRGLWYIVDIDVNRYWWISVV